MKIKGLHLARQCRNFALNKKATDPVILDLRKVEGPAEFFLICSVQSDPQLKAVANEIEKSMKEEEKVSPWSVSGTPASRWIVMDYGDLMVHIMHEEKRYYYHLEELWGDAVRVP